MPSPASNSQRKKKLPQGTTSQLPGLSPGSAPAKPNKAPWTFLTNHSHVLLLIARTPESRMRDLAEQIGITERAVQRIIDELEQGGYLTIAKQGRRNVYTVRGEPHLRHPVEAARTVGDLIRMVNGSAPQKN